MAIRPSVSDLSRLTDPAEREYVDAKRGIIPDDQLVDDLHQFRMIQAADRAPVEPADAAIVDSIGTEEPTPPPPISPDEPSTNVPTFDEFYAETSKLNPTYSRDQIKQIYDNEFAPKPDVMPSFEEFRDETKPLNPEYSDEQLHNIWYDRFGSKGAVEANQGFSGTLLEGAKSTLRSLRATGNSLFGNNENITALGEEQRSAARDPTLDRLLIAIDKRKKELGPEASWFDTGKALGQSLIENPKGAALLFTEQLPNTVAALGSAAVGAAAGSLLGPAGTIAGGIAGLFAANTGLETGGKLLEKSAGGLTELERREGIIEGAKKGSVISAVDIATLGGTKWLMGTTARAMEAATLRTLEQEGVDITSRSAIEQAATNPAIVQKVQRSQAEASQAVNTLAQKGGRGIAEGGLESLGEGVGEYLGELAATGKPDKMEAFIEAFAGLGQSTAEIGLSGILSRYDAKAAVFGAPPDVSAPEIRNILKGGTVDDTIKQAEKAISDVPPVENTDIDRFIEKERTPVSDVQHEVNKAAYENVLSAIPQVKKGADGIFRMHGKEMSSRVFRPEELPDETPDGKTVTKSVYEALDTVLKAQGRNLVVYESNEHFQGLVRRTQYPNTIFLSQKTATDPVVVAFHEAGHLMEGTPLYKSFQQVLFSELQKDAKKTALYFHGRRTKTGNLIKGEGQLSDERLFNEISADVVGDAMTDPLFMEKVYTRLSEQVGDAKAATETQSFLDRLKVMITKVKEAIVGKTFTTRNGERLALKYVKNLERVHDALAKAVADLYYNTGKVQTNTVENTDEDYTQDSRRHGEERLILPPDVATEFERVGHLQRGAPESAMHAVHEANGGGVLNPVVEHAGDLIHRMTHMAKHGTALQPYVQEKTNRVLRFLTHAYGFEKEMQENIAGNAAYFKKSPLEYAAKIKEALVQYAAEHAKLPVYNYTQWLARQIAISIGHRRWKMAIEHLQELKKIADSDEFTQHAFRYTKNEEGRLVPYERPIKVALIGETPSGGMRIRTDLEHRKYHILEDVDGFMTGTKISGKELKDRGYRPDVVETMSHEQDQAVRDLTEAGIVQASPRSDVGHKRTEKGYVSAPHHVKNPQGLVKLRERLMTLAKEGSVGKTWYEQSSKAILDWAEGDKKLAEKIVGLLAIYSPMQQVSGNTTIALKAYYQWATGQPITATNTQGKVSAERAQAWMDNHMNEREITGVKRNNFYINLMREINPEVLNGERQGVTVDMWMARAMGYLNTVVGEGQYFFSEREIKRVAEKLGWEPQQAQAAIWVAIKSRIEDVYGSVRERAIKKGWLAQKVTPKGNTSWEPKDGESRKKFEQLLLAESLNIPLPDVTNATYNYADALRERVAQISWEATPGKSTGVLPGIHTSSYAKQAEYLNEIDKVLRNEEGQDKIAILVKLAGANTILGPGGWQGGISISGQTFTAVATDREGNGKLIVSKPARDLVNLYADIRGYVLSQEGVYWHFPIFDESKKNANGVDIDFGRPLSVEEMKALYESIITWAGHDEWAPAFTARGARILNFKDNNQLGFQATIKSALQLFPLDHTFKTFRSDGDARMNDWKENPHGEEYRSRIGESGRPDLLRTVEDLRQAVIAVNRRFSEQYGWGSPDVAREPEAGDVIQFSQAPPPMGIAVDALPKDAKAPKVDWNREQAQNWITNNPDDWKKSGWGSGRPVIYRAYVTDEDMPRVRTEMDQGREYDWKAFKKTGVYPPIVIVRHANGVASKLEDGHHRMTYWREKGFDHFPAWIVDFRRSAKRKVNTENNTQASPMPHEKPYSLIRTVRPSGEAVYTLWKNLLNASPEYIGRVTKLEKTSDSLSMNVREQYAPVVIPFKDISGVRFDNDTRELSFVNSPKGDNLPQITSRLDEPQPSPMQRTVPAVPYEVTEPGNLDKIVRIVQDKNIDIKRVVESIRAAGGLVPEDLNPILREEMYQKRAQARSEDFTNKELLPMIEVMRANKVSLDELDKYAHARHVIDDRLNERLQQMNPDMPNNEALSGMTNEEAQKILDSYTGTRAETMRNLMSRLDKMVNTTRDLMVDYGLEKQSRVDEWREQYKSYVPLRRLAFDEEGHPTGTGRSIRGSTVRERLGSNLEVSSILANVAQARDQVITRGEKMRPVVAFAGLLMLHPNKSIASLDKPATIDMVDPNTGLTVTVPGDLADYKVPRVRRVDPLTGEVRAYPDPMYKGRDNVVNFRIKGVDYAIVFNEKNERAVEIAKAFKELDTGQLTGIVKAVAPYTRYLASINTQYNPIFGIVNFIRDAQFAMLTLSSTPLAGKQTSVVKNAMQSLAGIYQDARDSRLGLPPSSATAQMWERFQHVGGPTGYRDLFFSATDRAKEIERLLDPNTWKNVKSPRDLGRRLEETALFKLLSDYNLTMENAIRLGVFKTAVENGISDLEAASYAKNITVNFNKRGQIGAQMGALYAFFNANVQGTARILETLFTYEPEKGVRLSEAGKKIVAGGILIGILQTAALALSGFDDEEPPEFVKQKNLVFPAPGTEKGYLMIPMPLGFNLLPNIGRLAAESMIAIAQGRPKDVIKKGFNLLEAMTQTLSPTGGAGDIVAELSPTVVDPFVALKANKDWTGKSIYKEDQSSLAPTPGHARAKDTATVWAMVIAKAINWSTGGTEYTPGLASPSPDAIDYLIQQATGGVGREVSKASQVVQTAVSGEELPLHKVPVVGRFAGSASGSAGVRDKFYDNIRAVNVAAEEIKGRALHHEELQSVLAKHPEARFEKAAIQVERQLGELRKAKQLAIDRGATREMIRMREEQMTALMTRFNAAVNEARKLR